MIVQAKLSQILLGATELVCKNMKLHQVEAQNYLKEHYPICSKIGPWMQEKLQQVCIIIIIIRARTHAEIFVWLPAFYINL